MCRSMRARQAHLVGSAHFSKDGLQGERESSWPEQGRPELCEAALAAEAGAQLKKAEGAWQPATNLTTGKDA